MVSCHHCVEKQSLVPVESIMSKLSLIFWGTITLLGCIMSANATFGHVFAKIQELEKLVILQLNIAVENTVTVTGMSPSSMTSMGPFRPLNI